MAAHLGSYLGMCRHPSRAAFSGGLDPMATIVNRPQGLAVVPVHVDGSPDRPRRSMQVVRQHALVAGVVPDGLPAFEYRMDFVQGSSCLDEREPALRPFVPLALRPGRDRLSE